MWELWINRPKDRSMGELALLLVSHSVTKIRERYSSAHPPLAPVSGRKSGLRVMRSGELSLSPTTCGTEESRPCTLPRQCRIRVVVVRGRSQAS